MSNYIEYGVKLTDGQKSKLASAILNKSPLTLRLKHSHLRGCFTKGKTVPSRATARLQQTHFHRRNTSIP